jgi:hypothetical protein
MDAGMYSQALAVTPHDSTNLVSMTRGLYIGVAGDVTAVIGGSAVLFKAVPVGILPVAVTRVNATATTATNILALY